MNKNFSVSTCAETGRKVKTEFVPVLKYGGLLEFTDPDKLQKQIDKYFETCKKTIAKKIYNGQGEVIEEIMTPPTFAGLATFLDVDRTTLYNYASRKDYLCNQVILRAKQRIIEYLEIRLYIEGKSGQIFVAKNYGYRDTPTIDQSQHIHISGDDKHSKLDLIREKLKQNDTQE